MACSCKQAVSPRRRGACTPHARCFSCRLAARYRLLCRCTRYSLSTCRTHTVLAHTAYANAKHTITKHTTTILIQLLDAWDTHADQWEYWCGFCWTDGARESLRADRAGDHFFCWANKLHFYSTGKPILIGTAESSLTNRGLSFFA